MSKIFFSYTLFLCLLYWASIVPLTKFLTILHSLINSLHLSPLSSLSHSWNSFNRYYFSIYIHVYRIFPPYSPTDPLSLYLPPSHWYPPPDIFLYFPFLSLTLDQHKIIWSLSEISLAMHSPHTTAPTSLQ
jgi:hypothetical protein